MASRQRDVLSAAIQLFADLFYGRAMAVVTIFGRVLPEGKAFQVNDMSPMRWVSDEISMRMKIDITSGSVVVTCEVQEYKESKLGVILAASTMPTRALVNLHSFATGEPFTLVFDEVERPVQGRQTLGFQNPALASLVTSYGNSDLSRVSALVLTDERLMLLFYDLSLAVSAIPMYQPIACGRALDGIRNFLAPDKPTKQGWPIVHAALNVSKNYVIKVSGMSEKPRHAEIIRYSPAEIQECLERTWVVTNRFLEYRLRGSHPLTAPEFPLL